MLVGTVVVVLDALVEVGAAAVVDDAAGVVDVPVGFFDALQTVMSAAVSARAPKTLALFLGSAVGWCISGEGYLLLPRSG